MAAATCDHCWSCAFSLVNHPKEMKAKYEELIRKKPTEKCNANLHIGNWKCPSKITGSGCGSCDDCD